MTETEAKNFPATVTEAVKMLLSDLPLETKHQIENSSEEGLFDFHFELGVGSRNKYGLWEKNSKLLEDCEKYSGNPGLHVDDASGIIIKALWERLQEYPAPKVIWNKDQYGD